MAEKDWQVGPVLKDKPGSQGTLFRGGTKFSSDARFPRGYTPERQAAVRGAIQGTGWNDDNGLAPAAHRRAIADTVARSTVPLAHLQGLQWAHVTPNQAITAGDTAAGAYFKGQENTSGYGAERTAGMIGVKPKYVDTSTTIHEIGHHVSHAIAENPHTENYSYNTPEGGHEEAVADNYASEHYRDRKGRPEPRGPYGGGEYGGHIERSPEFWSGYRSNRHYASDGSVEAENKRYYQHFPEEEEHPDGSVEQPLIHREREYGEYTDKGQVKRDSVGDINEDAIPTHANHDWSKYRV